MKKRLLVLLAAGVFFAPPVFALDGLNKVQLGFNAEMRDMRGANCDRKDKSVSADVASAGKEVVRDAKSTATTARDE